MANEELGPHETIVRFYRINRIPHLYGKVNGEKIWGGPYTGYQLIFAVVAFFIGVNSMDSWGSFGIFGNIIVLAAGVFAASWAGQWISMNVNDPFVAVTGLGTMLSAPSAGTIDGQKIERAAKAQKWAGRNFDQDLSALYADTSDAQEVSGYLDDEALDLEAEQEEIHEVEELPAPAGTSQANPQDKAAVAVNLTAVERLLGMTERSMGNEER